MTVAMWRRIVSAIVVAAIIVGLAMLDEALFMKASVYSGVGYVLGAHTHRAWFG